MRIGTAISSAFKNTVLTVTARVLGKLTKTCNLATPFGMQTKPVGNWQCIYADTLNADNNPTIVGFINQNYSTQLQDGEVRLFAIDPADGTTEKSSVWLRNDGTVLIGKNRDPSLYTNFFVLYNELKEKLDALEAKLPHVHADPASGFTGGTLDPISHSPITYDIDFSNIRANHTKTDG